MKSAGGYVLVQAPATAKTPAPPRAVLALNSVATILPWKKSPPTWSPSAAPTSPHLKPRRSRHFLASPYPARGDGGWGLVWWAARPEVGCANRGYKDCDVATTARSSVHSSGPIARTGVSAE